MRDPARIPIVLARLRAVWERNPDLRLGQILCAAVLRQRQGPDLFSVEDEALTEMVEALDSTRTVES